MNRADRKPNRAARHTHPSDAVRDYYIGAAVAVAGLGFVIGAVATAWQMWLS